MTQKTDKKANNSPTGEKVDVQVVDNIESGYSNNSPRVKMSSDMEIAGAIKHQVRMNQLSGATLIIELARVQASYKSGAKDLRLLSSASSFKEFVEVECGLNYRTISNKISHLKSIGPQMLQMFEQLGVPVTLQRQIKKLPADLRKRMDEVLSKSPAENAEEVKAVFKELTVHTVALQDKLDEASTKTKAELIDERDQANDRFELVEDRMVNMSERMEKQQDRLKKLLASQNIDDKTVAMRKMNDTLSVYFNALKNADLSADDLDLRTEKNRFLAYITKAHEIGLS